MTDFTMFDLNVTDGVAVATFNRPDKMNTFTPVVMREMIELFDQTDADDSIRAVIVTGSSMTASGAMAAAASCCASSVASSP